METWNSVIGLITPPGSGIMKPEFLQIRPTGVGFRQTILFLDDKSAHLSEQERIDRMIDELQRAVKILDMCEVGVITQSGMPFIFTKGGQFEIELREDLQKLTKIPVVFMASALIEALRVLDAKKLSVATYYSDNFNRLFKEYLESNGCKVLSIQGLPETKSIKPPSLKYAQISESRVFDFTKEVHQVAPGADAAVICGGAMRSINVIKKLEDELEVPVISANQALFWKAFKEVGVKQDLSDYGRLMGTLR